MEPFFQFIRRINTSTTQFILGTLASFWGLWVLLPMHTFEDILGFQPSMSVVPEVWWGVVLLAVGFITLSTIFVDKFNYSHFFVIALALIHLLFWGFVFASFVLHEPSSIAVPTYFAVILTAFLNYVKIYVENGTG